MPSIAFFMLNVTLLIAVALFDKVIQKIAKWPKTSVVKHVVMRTNVEALVKQKNLRPTQDLSLLIFSLLNRLICFTKNTQVSFFTNSHLQPTPFALLSIRISHPINLSLSFSLLCLVPTLFSPVSISYEYSDDFIYIIAD